MLVIFPTPSSCLSGKGVLRIVWLGAQSQIQFLVVPRFLEPLRHLPVDKYRDIKDELGWGSNTHGY